jgi:hypothetical protein
VFYDFLKGFRFNFFAGLAGLLGTLSTLASGRSLSTILGPMPFTLSRSSTVLKAPFWVRYSTMACALAAMLFERIEFQKVSGSLKRVACYPPAARYGGIFFNIKNNQRRR